MQKPNPAFTMIQNIDPDLMHEGELAAALGVDVSRLKNMVRKGTLKMKPAKIGSVRVYRRSAIAGLVNSQMSTPPAADSK